MSGKTLEGRPRACVAVFVCVAAVALLLDQITKLWALSALSDGRSMRIIEGLLSFTLVRNPGASLGLGSNFTWVISLLAMVACVVIVVLGLRTASKAWAATLGCAFAGALGNLVDRVSYADGFLNGKVVDFIDYGWSVGNVADIFLTVAGVAIVLMIVMNVPFGGESKAAGAFDPAGSPAGAAAVPSTESSESSVESSAQPSEQEGNAQ